MTTGAAGEGGGPVDMVTGAGDSGDPGQVAASGKQDQPNKGLVVFPDPTLQESLCRRLSNSAPCDAPVLR